MKSNYVVLIKTDSYAGNFERELCAHLTGHIGECGVGNEFVNETIRNKFENYLINVPDEYGCNRPVTLGCDLPKKANGTADDVAIFFDVKPTIELIDIIKERILTFNQTISEKHGWFKKPIQFHNIMLLWFDVNVVSEIV